MVARSYNSSLAYKNLADLTDYDMNIPNMSSNEYITLLPASNMMYTNNNKTLLNLNEMQTGGNSYNVPLHQNSVTSLLDQQYYNDASSMQNESLCLASLVHQNSNSLSMEVQVDSSSSYSKHRKRKSSFCEYDEDDDSKSTKTVDDCRKQNHSEIEKRRRDKMNTYIMELSSMIPMCHAMSRKLDKLTVLRMAVQHLKTIRGAVHSYTEGLYKPAFLSDQELKTLILNAADGFLFVVGCDRGKILYVSESVLQTLNYSQNDLLGQSMFDILHPKDVAKVKEQLTSSDLGPRERLIDAKTMLPVKTDLPHQNITRLSPGARRSFFCRIKSRLPIQIKEEADTTTGSSSNNMSTQSGRRSKKHHNSSDKKYSVIHCTGYLKCWSPSKMSVASGNGNNQDSNDCDQGNISCLVAVGRLQTTLSSFYNPSDYNSSASHHQSTTNSDIINPCPRTDIVRKIQFVSRHAMDGKFLFIDQRSTLVLGFLPQELLGTSMYEYYCHEDISMLAEIHKCVLLNSDNITTQPYRFRTKNGSFIKIQSEWKSFKNPWTKEFEYLIAKNTVIPSDSSIVDSSGIAPKNEEQNNYQIQDNFDNIMYQSNERVLSRLINSEGIEASKIGRKIAEQFISLDRRNNGNGDSSCSNSPNPQQFPNISVPPFQSDLPSENQNSLLPADLKLNANNNNGNSSDSFIRNNVMLTINNSENEEDIVKMMGTNSGNSSDSSTNLISNDGNDEAAMSVIMSLLEADAGLGGPVDFSGLPWPLP